MYIYIYIYISGVPTSLRKRRRCLGFRKEHRPNLKSRKRAEGRLQEALQGGWWGVGGGGGFTLRGAACRFISAIALITLLLTLRQSVTPTPPGGGHALERGGAGRGAWLGAGVGRFFRAKARARAGGGGTRSRTLRSSGGRWQKKKKRTELRLWSGGEPRRRRS